MSIMEGGGEHYGRWWCGDDGGVKVVVVWKKGKDK